MSNTKRKTTPNTRRKTHNLAAGRQYENRHDVQATLPLSPVQARIPFTQVQGRVPLTPQDENRLPFSQVQSSIPFTPVQLTISDAFTRKRKRAGSETAPIPVGARVPFTPVPNENRLEKRMRLLDQLTISDASTKKAAPIVVDEVIDLSTPISSPMSSPTSPISSPTKMTNLELLSPTSAYRLGWEHGTRASEDQEKNLPLWVRRRELLRQTLVMAMPMAAKMDNDGLGTSLHDLLGKLEVWYMVSYHLGDKVFRCNFARMHIATADHGPVDCHVKRAGGSYGNWEIKLLLQGKRQPFLFQVNARELRRETWDYAIFVVKPRGVPYMDAVLNTQTETLFDRDEVLRRMARQKYDVLTLARKDFDRWHDKDVRTLWLNNVSAQDTRKRGIPIGPPSPIDACVRKASLAEFAVPGNGNLRDYILFRTDTLTAPNN